jgi:hypothetical protein
MLTRQPPYVRGDLPAPEDSGSAEPAGSAKSSGDAKK